MNIKLYTNMEAASSPLCSSSLSHTLFVSETYTFKTHTLFLLPSPTARIISFPSGMSTCTHTHTYTHTHIYTQTHVGAHTCAHSG